MHILHAAPNTLYQSKASFVGDHFIYSHDLKSVIQGWYCREKFDSSHSEDLKGY